jgi:hypothetical protein
MAVVRIPVPGRPWGGRRYELDLAALEVGDRVATVAYSMGRPSTTTYTVVRRTPTQVVCEATAYGRTWQARWRVADGKQVGEPYGDQLLPTDDDEVLEAHQRLLLGQLHDRVARVLADTMRTTTSKDRETTHADRLAAVALVAELAADTADKMNALEDQRVKEGTSV